MFLAKREDLGNMHASFRSVYAQNPDSCFRCCPWLASRPFLPFSFQAHLLRLFLPRTDRSHLPVDITSFHAFVPNLPTHPWRMFCRKQLKPELWVPWPAWVPQGSHLPTGSQTSLGACFCRVDPRACLTLILSKKEVKNCM